MGTLSHRDGAVDVLKTVAILGVLCIHAAVAGYANPLGSGAWTWAVFWGSLSRAAVPMFLMCSGALMMDPNKDLPLRRLLGKNLLRLVIALFFWAFAYQVYHLLLWNSPITLPVLVQKVKDVLLFRHESHLYYLHMMLIVYLLLPGMRVITAHADRRTVEYLLVLWFALGILYPTLRLYWPLKLINGIPAQWGLSLTYASVGYGLLGWYLREYARNWKPWAAIGAAGFALTFAGVLIPSLERGELVTTAFNGNAPGVALMAAGICGAAFVLLRDRPPLPGTAYVSKASFCVYLVHLFFFHSLGKRGINALLFHPALSIPMMVGLLLALSLAVYALLSRIPVVKKWLV